MYLFGCWVAGSQREQNEKPTTPVFPRGTITCLQGLWELNLKCGMSNIFQVAKGLQVPGAVVLAKDWSPILA